jgi:uncharacterized protein (TIGR02246 family)
MPLAELRAIAQHCGSTFNPSPPMHSALPSRRTALAFACTVPAALGACATATTTAQVPTLSRDETAAQVRAAEQSFAKTMADRDLEAFAQHVGEDAVFLGGGKALRGRAAVVAGWTRYFDKPAAPFSWSPEVIEVIEPGRLTYSEGPVLSPDGVNFARFYTLWRRESDGRWRVALDNGYEVCKAK